ncbi:MAG: DNA translocase FtsK, partial [Eggerthellaceae bacterium]|nr:DNA translocase FtsK [Eggerthellaceae bacterium]
GVIIIGFSISKLIEKIRAKKAEHAAAAEAAAIAEAEGDVVAAPPFARVRRARSRGLDAGVEGRAGAAVGSATDAALSGAETGVLVKPAAALSSSPTSVLKPSERTLRGNRRHRAAQPAADAAMQVAGGDAAAQPTTRLVPLSGASSATDAQGVEEADQAPVALTRKLGKKRADADAKPASRANAASKSSASPVATPHPQEGFELPPMSLLASAGKGAGRGKASESELSETAARLQETLEDFGIMAQVVGWVAGPTVTLFKVDLPAGVRVSRVTALNDDIALALAAPGVRIFAPIPGTNYVGIEVPNRTRQTVLLSDVLTDAGPGPLQIAIGKDVEGHSIVSDLAKMPHLLIGGTTGSGKSVSINAMIMSILMRATPAEVRFIMIDPKRVEFTPYNGIPHLYVPVVTEAKEAASALSWGVAEMERRLKVFSKVGARNIGQFNAKVQAAKAEAERVREAGGEPEHWEYDDELPYIVIIIDELADLMMNVGKEVEFSISRIAQLARAAGIHLIVATQRPSTNVVTGLIKANITNRIAFNVASGIDSRVILDTPGAENLIGLGDLLLSKPELSKPQRIQGCYVSEDEINAVVSMLKAQGEPEYHSEILSTNIVTLGASSPSGDGGSESDDPLLWDAADIVVSSGLGSTSNIQRRLKVGYARAGRIMDQLEEKGVVGPANGSKPREVLLDDPMELETLKAFEAHDED